MPVVTIGEEEMHMVTILLIGAGAYFIFSGALLIALLRAAARPVIWPVAPRRRAS
jgi:hypothetical protein